MTSNLSNFFGGGSGVEVGEVCRLDPSYYINTGGGSFLQIGSKYFLRNGAYVPYPRYGVKYNGDLQGPGWFVGLGAGCLVADMDGGLNGVMVLAQSNPMLCYTTTDGFLNYTQRTVATGITNTATGIAYGGGKWVIVGTSNFSAVSSDNGLTWTYGTGMPFAARNVVWTGSRFVSVGFTSVAYSTDGLTWTTVASGQFNVTAIGAITSDKNGKIAVNVKLGSHSNNNNSYTVIYSTDHGNNWGTVTNIPMYGALIYQNSILWDPILACWVNFAFHFTGGGPAQWCYGYSSTDLVNWSSRFSYSGAPMGGIATAFNSSGQGTLMAWDTTGRLYTFDWRPGTSFKNNTMFNQVYSGPYDNSAETVYNASQYKGYKLHKVDANNGRCVLIPAPCISFGGTSAGPSFPIMNYYNNIYINDALPYPKFQINIKAPTYTITGGFGESGCEYYWRIK